MSAIPLDKQDINLIHNMDFKTYHYAFDATEYKTLVNRGTALSTFAVLHDKKVGFAIWERGTNRNPAYIIRLGVLLAYRKKGIARKMLGWICEDLRKNKNLKENNSLRIVLPQVICLGPNDPDDVSGFMGKVGFRCVEIMKDVFFHYGRHEDGLVFERKL